MPSSESTMSYEAIPVIPLSSQTTGAGISNRGSDPFPYSSTSPSSVFFAFMVPISRVNTYEDGTPALLRTMVSLIPSGRSSYLKSTPSSMPEYRTVCDIGSSG